MNSLVQLDEQYRRDQLPITLGTLVLAAAALIVTPRLEILPSGEIAALGLFVLTGIFFIHQFGVRGAPLAIGFLGMSLLVSVMGLRVNVAAWMVLGGLTAAGFLALYAAWIHGLQTEDDLRQTTQTEMGIQMAEAKKGLEDLRDKMRRQEANRKIWTSLVEVVHGCSATLKFDQLSSFILRALESLFPTERVSLWMSSTVGQDASKNIPPGRRYQARPYEPESSDGLDRMAWEQRKNIMVHDQDADPRFEGPGQYRFTGRSALVCPLLEETQVYGNLRVTSHQPERFNHEDMVILNHVTGVVSMSASNVRLYERMEELALTDGQTGLFKRYHFERRFTEESKRARRKNNRLGMVLFDIDFFKRVNDTHGHATGDVVLQEVGRIIREVDWGGALPCRWGGEEFLLVLPDATPEQTRARVETLMGHIKAQEFRAVESGGADGKSFQVTVSVGIATFPRDSGDPEQLFQICDRRLYRAKNTGRDRYIDHD